MRLIPLGAAALAGALALAPAARAEMSAAEREAFRAEVRAYLLENPEVLMEAFTALEQRQQLDQVNADLARLQDHASEIYTDPASWAGGNLQGDITVVEFIDYRCGYCRKANAEVEELVASDGNIRFVLKEYPILGEESVLASRFAISVLQIAGPEPYKAVHDKLIAFRGDITTEALGRLADEMKLDRASILAHMDKDEVTAVIAANHKLAATLEISGTPTFVVDRTMVRGYVPLDGMRQIVEGQRKG
ncbi:DsbA family protein [Cereibacter sphaeroides]|uniref:DsbA family protein n=2 Tax=Rhodobacterales TaxID=204455 RepID=UPI000E5B9B75|nr:DsbA family protein [Cereibacter sphaeroides]RHZ94849.1 DsbA family protein [Cereibacter sphaeroides]